MEAVSSASYAPLSGTAAAGVGFVSSGVTKVRGACTQRFQVYYLFVNALFLLTFTCAALGAPWIVNDNVPGGVKVIYGLSTTYARVCTGDSCESTDSVWNGGIWKAAGDPVSALLTLVLLVSLSILLSSLSFLLTICKVADSPLDANQLKSYRIQLLAAWVLTTIATITFPAVTLPTLAAPSPPGPGNVHRYGGGFACALMNVLFSALALGAVESLLATSASAATPAAPAFVPLPPQSGPVAYDNAKSQAAPAFQAEPAYATGYQSAYQTDA